MANKKARVAIIGVGNCASSLVQGIQFYKGTTDDATVPGIMHTPAWAVIISAIAPAAKKWKILSRASQTSNTRSASHLT